MTLIQISNFCHVKSYTYIMLICWVCINFVLPKKKKKLGHSCPLQPDHIATYNVYCYCQPSSRSIGRKFFAKLKSSIAKYLCLPYWILYIYYNHFPLTDIPKCIKSELSSTQVQCVQSHFCRNFKHYLDFFGQACKEPVGILNNVMSNLKYLFQLFSWRSSNCAINTAKGK